MGRGPRGLRESDTTEVTEHIADLGFPGSSPAMQETLVRFLGWEDPLEEGMATHSSILVWRIPWTEKPGVLQSRGLRRLRQG